MEKLLFHAQYAGVCRKGYRRRKKKYTSKSFLFCSFSQSSYKTPNHSSIVLQRKSSQFWVMKVTHWVHAGVQIP